MKLRPFELALVVIFSLLALFALILLTNYKPAADSNDALAEAVGKVTIWGTLPGEAMEGILKELIATNEVYKNVTYVYHHADDFDSKLITALADNQGPDLILVSNEKLVKMRKRIKPVSYDSFPIRDIRTMYIDGAQIYALSDGLYGYPIAVDPLMMYWNRDILATAGYLEAPKTWESLINTYFPDLIQRDFDRTLQRSVVAMGEYGNIRNAFGVISTLLLQGGSQKVVENSDSKYLVRLQATTGESGDPLRAAADFYTRFSKPSNTLYSWNRSFSEDRMRFISEDLALYFGYGSEGPQIEKINPNLNFDIAEVPQGSADTTRRTYGKFYALSLLKSSDNINGATAIMTNFGSAQLADKIAIASDMVPVYRDSVSAGSNDTYGRITYKSASIALGWLNPDLAETDDIFEKMTQDINENRRTLEEAVADVTTRLEGEY